LTLVSDHDTGKIIWGKPGKDTDTLNAFFDELPDGAALALVMLACGPVKLELPYHTSRHPHSCSRARDKAFDAIHIVRGYLSVHIIARDGQSGRHSPIGRVSQHTNQDRRHRH
jgi:transposase